MWILPRYHLNWYQSLSYLPIYLPPPLSLSCSPSSLLVGPQVAALLPSPDPASGTPLRSFRDQIWRRRSQIERRRFGSRGAARPVVAKVVWCGVGGPRSTGGGRPIRHATHADELGWRRAWAREATLRGVTALRAGGSAQ